MIITPIAEEMGKKLPGTTLKVSGPFGLQCQVIVNYPRLKSWACDVIARALACSYREHRGTSSIDALLSTIDFNKIAREERDLIVQVAAKLKLTKKFFNPSAIDQARYR